MRQGTASRRAFGVWAPYAVAFLLPLGFFGVAGVVLAGAYVLVELPSFLRLGWRPVLVALPLAVITVVSAVAGGVNGEGLAAAVGMALLLTLGFQAMRLIRQQADAVRLIVAFLAGALALAASVSLDFVLARNRLPSGLFLDPALHNWAGTLFALAFPLALGLAGRANLRLRAFGLISAATLAAATALALSWVGMLAILVGALALGIARGRTLAWTVLAVCVLAAASFGLWKPSWGKRLYELQIRGYSLAQWEFVVRERLVIFREGIILGLAKPWLGWGFSTHYGNLANVPGLVKARAELTAEEKTTNLLKASEALDALPWRGFHARMLANEATAPDGTRTADLVLGDNMGGHRVYQLVPVPAGDSLSYTLAIWVRTERGKNDLALSLRDVSGHPHNVLALSSSPEGKVLGNRAVRYQLDTEWRRLLLKAEFRTPPAAGLYALIYLDGYHAGSTPEDRFYAWGAQLNEGEELAAYTPTEPRGPLVAMNDLSHFHNWFVQTLFETGLIGLVALLGSLVWLFTRIGSPLGMALRSSLLAFLVAQFFDYAALQSNILLCALLIGSLGLPLAPERACINSLRKG